MFQKYPNMVESGLQVLTAENGLRAAPGIIARHSILLIIYFVPQFLYPNTLTITKIISCMQL